MQFEDRKSIDAVKGILILFVVLGHSVLATEFAALKTFIYFISCICLPVAPLYPFPESGYA